MFCASVHRCSYLGVPVDRIVLQQQHLGLWCGTSKGGWTVKEDIAQSSNSCNRLVTVDLDQVSLLTVFTGSVDPSHSSHQASTLHVGGWPEQMLLFSSLE